jgi:hypothetical protein
MHYLGVFGVCYALVNVDLRPDGRSPLRSDDGIFFCKFLTAVTERAAEESRCHRGRSGLGDDEEIVLRRGHGEGGGWVNDFWRLEPWSVEVSCSSLSMPCLGI